MTIIDDALNTTVSVAADVVNGVQGLLSRSLPNRVVSYIATLPITTFHHSGRSDISVLNNSPAFTAPDTQYQRENSPTVSDFMNAANAEYSIIGSPAHLTPFEVDGRQLELINVASGMSSRVWRTEDNQVIIAYSGTFGGDTQFVTPIQDVGQLLADLPSVAGKVSTAQKDAVDWAQYVVQQANLQGINTNDVFITGHSLGADLAEYVGQQTGLGGIGFSGTGIPLSDTAVSDDSNFVSIVNYGDVWGSFASDVEGDQPAAPAVDFVNPNDRGELPHWGSLVMVGDPQDQANLIHSSIQNPVDVALNFLLNATSYHYPANNAANLGVALQPFSINQDLGGRSRGDVFAAADMTLDQLVAANNDRTEFHSPILTGQYYPSQDQSAVLIAPTA